MVCGLMMWTLPNGVWPLVVLAGPSRLKRGRRQRAARASASQKPALWRVAS
jgi:hypothetical protein